MARKYDASRREEAARRTREAILNAAVKLHGQGVIDYEALAAEANVSIPTIRKHFPTRDRLFEGCIALGMSYAHMPDMELIAATGGAEERIQVAVTELHSFFEPYLGHIWFTYTYRDESAVLESLLVDLDAMINEVARVAAAAWRERVDDQSQALGLITGLCHYLTYYSLRRPGGLTPEQATERIIAMLLYSLNALEVKDRKEAVSA
jgi:AcrR family transcriptional regulator